MNQMPAQFRSGDSLRLSQPTEGAWPSNLVASSRSSTTEVLRVRGATFHICTIQFCRRMRTLGEMSDERIPAHEIAALSRFDAACPRLVPLRKFSRSPFIFHGRSRRIDLTYRGIGLVCR